MTASVVMKIVTGGIAALFVVQGLVMLGTSVGNGIVWRVLPGAVVLGFVVPRELWVRAVAGVVGFAGAAGFLWIVDQTVLQWFETGAPPEWKRHLYQALLFGLYLSVYVVWVVLQRSTRVRAA